MKGHKTMRIGGAQLLLLGIMTISVMGCEVNRDPMGNYDILKDSIAPHNNHEPPMLIRPVAYDPLNAIIADIVVVEPEPFEGFVEGQEGEFKLRVKSMAIRGLRYQLRTEGFPGEVQPVQDSKRSDTWTIKWTPEPGFVSSEHVEQSLKFQLIVDLLEEGSDAQTLKALNKRSISAVVSLSVFAENRAPQILGIEWDKEGESILLNEGEQAKFRVIVQSPVTGAKEAPEIDVQWASYLDSEKIQVLDGTPFIKADPDSEVEQIDERTWVYPMIFDAKNEKIAYPNQILTDKEIDTGHARYKVLVSTFQDSLLQTMSEDEEALPASSAKAIDFRVKYSGKNTEMVFPWSGSEQKLTVCKGEVFRFDFDIETNTGIGKIKVDEEEAIRQFRRAANFSGDVGLKCQNQESQLSKSTCALRWVVPDDISSGEYDLPVNASVFPPSGDEISPLTEQSRTLNLIVKDKSHNDCKQSDTSQNGVRK